MSTGTEIAKAALQKIGAHSVASPANPEAIESARKSLNSMLEMWLTDDIRIGFTPLDVVADDLNEPADARNGIVNNLAIELLADFPGLNQPAGLVSAARSQKAMIKKFYQSHSIPKRRVSGTLPRGEGNNQRWNRRDDRIFFDKVDELED